MGGACDVAVSVTKRKGTYGMVAMGAGSLNAAYDEGREEVLGLVRYGKGRHPCIEVQQCR